jgi:hypothetical protein
MKTILNINSIEDGSIGLIKLSQEVKDKLDGNSVNEIIKIEYSGLTELISSNSLIPSQKYRITDYVTTTAQENTKSANHPFDIIVEALNENTLSEDAKAIIHENVTENNTEKDTYFINNELSAWELKYCVDNDTNRFAWADSTNGKGVIYYLKDEFNNECWYDFKNIQFKRNSSWLTTYKSKFTSLSASSQQEIWFYTFSRTSGTTSVTISDDSLINSNSSSIYPCRNNTIGMYSKDEQQDYKIKHYLNNTIFIGNGAESNHIGENNCNNTFTGIYNNYIDMNCQDNIVSSGFSYNHIGIYFKGNKIFGKFINNNIGNTASGNTVNDTLSYNTIENNFKDNTFHKTFQFNKVENNFYGNKLNKIDSCNFSDFFYYNNSENSGPIEKCNFGHQIYRCSDLPSMSSITFDDEVVQYEEFEKGLSNITLSDGRNALNVLSSLGYNNTTQILFTKKGDKYQVIDNFNNSNAINYIHDLGVVNSSGDAEDIAKNANIATNQKIHLIKYSVSGKTGLIEQNVENKDSNNIKTKQIIHWDGLRKTRTLEFSNIFGGWTLIKDTDWEELKDVKNDEWDSISGNVQENSLKIQENSLKIVYSNQNHDFASEDNNVDCFGYVGKLNNINVKGDDIFIESIAVYTREKKSSPNPNTPVWCRLLKFNNNTWEIIYQSTESKTISSIDPETLFSFKVKPMDEMNKIIKSTDKIAIVYVENENDDVLSSVKLGFKSVSSPGGLVNSLTNNSDGSPDWCPSFRIGYLSTTDKHFYTSDIILKNPNKDASTSIATNIDGGELKVFKHPSNKAFIIRTNTSDTKGGLNRLELLTTDNYNSYTYKFPFADGTIPLGITVNDTTYTASTDDGTIDLSNALDIDLSEITDRIDEMVGIIEEDEEVYSRAFNMLYTEIEKIQQNGVIGGDGNGNTIISIEWNENSKLNNYTTTGVYFISGIRKTIEDNLPINSVGDNASISAQLIVTESPEGTTVTRSIIGQTLLLSNADGNETKIYTRSAKKLIPEGEGEYTTTWGDWTVCQGMKEVGQTETFDNYIDNGMYSGLYTKDNIYETFVLITVSNYAVAHEEKTVSQLKIGVGLDASISLTIRRGYGTDSLTWEGWQSIHILTGKYAISTMSLMSTTSTMSVDERQDEEINLLREEIENLRASIDYLKDEIKYLNQEINLLSNK